MVLRTENRVFGFVDNNVAAMTFQEFCKDMEGQGLTEEQLKQVYTACKPPAPAKLVKPEKTPNQQPETPDQQ